MRLQELYLRSYGVLQGFTIRFEQRNSYDTSDTHYKLDLIVGVNGTGKTTLLRALAQLFQALESSTRDTLPDFRLKYRIHEDLPGNETEVEISNLDEEDNRRDDDLLALRINREAEARAIERIDEQLLPGLVVAFTSGSEAGWERDFSSPVAMNGEDSFPLDTTNEQMKERLAEWYQSEVRSSTQTIDESRTTPGRSRFLLIRQQHLSLVILCGMLVDMDRALETTDLTADQHWHLLQGAMHESGIKALRGFSLKFHMNREARQNQTTIAFIDSLSAIAVQVVQTESDTLLVFDLRASEQEGTQHPVTRLVKENVNGLELFRRLLELTEAGGGEEPILREMHLFLERDYNDGQETTPSTEITDEIGKMAPLHLLNWLSDGERSFLGRLCLFSLLRKQEALILLDEPEVHFNDYWKRQLVHMLDQTLQEEYSHVLMTTHSSITLSDVLNEDIWILKRKNNHTGEPIPPPIRTLGADPSDIMVYVFGAETASGAQSAAYIQNKIETAEGQTELRELLGQVGPSQWRYLIRRRIHALEEVER